jgi:hypothetical protein
MLLRDKDGNAFSVHVFHQTGELQGRSKLSRAQRRRTRPLSIVTMHTGICKDRDANGICMHPVQIVAKAACGEKDVFSRKIGREVAIGRAMRMMGLPRQKQDELWAAYGRRGQREVR